MFQKNYPYDNNNFQNKFNFSQPTKTHSPIYIQSDPFNINIKEQTNISIPHKIQKFYQNLPIFDIDVNNDNLPLFQLYIKNEQQNLKIEDQSYSFYDYLKYGTVTSLTLTTLFFIGKFFNFDKRFSTTITEVEKVNYKVKRKGKTITYFKIIKQPKVDKPLGDNSIPSIPSISIDFNNDFPNMGSPIYSLNNLPFPPILQQRPTAFEQQILWDPTNYSYDQPLRVRFPPYSLMATPDPTPISSIQNQPSFSNINDPSSTSYVIENTAYIQLDSQRFVRENINLDMDTIDNFSYFSYIGPALLSLFSSAFVWYFYPQIIENIYNIIYNSTKNKNNLRKYGDPKIGYYITDYIYKFFKRFDDSLDYLDFLIHGFKSNLLHVIKRYAKIIKYQKFYDIRNSTIQLHNNDTTLLDLYDNKYGSQLIVNDQTMSLVHNEEIVDFLIHNQKNNKNFSYINNTIISTFNDSDIDIQHVNKLLDNVDDKYLFQKISISDIISISRFLTKFDNGKYVNLNKQKYEEAIIKFEIIMSYLREAEDFTQYSVNNLNLEQQLIVPFLKIKQNYSYNDWQFYSNFARDYLQQKIHYYVDKKYISISIQSFIIYTYEYFLLVNDEKLWQSINIDHKVFLGKFLPIINLLLPMLKDIQLYFPIQLFDQKKFNLEHFENFLSYFRTEFFEDFSDLSFDYYSALSTIVFYGHIMWSYINVIPIFTNKILFLKNLLIPLK